MTDAQEALDEYSSVTCIDHLDSFVHNHHPTIARALRLLAAIEAGEWKVVPVEPTVNSDKQALRKIEGLREDDWRPIETAPKDGTRILMYQREAGGEYGKIEYEDYYFVGWFDKYWYCCEYSAFEREPTHWMPLPEQPAQLAAQEEG